MTIETRKEEQGAWLSGPEAATYIGVTSATLAKWRQQGCGPPYSAALKRDPRYHKDDLNAFMRSRMVKNTAQAREARKA